MAGDMPAIDIDHGPGDEVVGGEQCRDFRDVSRFSDAVHEMQAGKAVRILDAVAGVDGRSDDAGQLFLPELREGFTRLDKAVEKVREIDARGPMMISVAPAFAAKWLAPRLERFSAAYPDIAVRISASLAVIDFQRDSFDAAIRLGRGIYPGLISTKLFDESVTPMCSPRLREAGHPLGTPDDLSHHLMLHDDSLDFDAAAPKWSAWLEAAGAKGVDPARGPHFSHPDPSLQAAIDGAGVVLGWQYLAAADLAAGRLISPFDLALPMDATPPSSKREKKIKN